MLDALEMTILPVTHDLGAFKVNRTLPARQRTMVGPFVFVDAFGPSRLPAGQGMDVRPHPHINLATVTYLFEGAIEHRDSIGSHQLIEPGAINLMTAGSGIVHSERSPRALRADGPSLYGMQTWLALPLLERLNTEFRDILQNGVFEFGEALPEEQGEPEIAHLSRLVFRFNRMRFGRLRAMIDVINQSGPEATVTAPPGHTAEGGLV